MSKKEELRIMEYFAEVETIEKYDPYFCSVGDAITIVIIGTFCGFWNLKQIHRYCPAVQLDSQTAKRWKRKKAIDACKNAGK